MSAAQSGLSHSTAVSASLATSTWSDLHRRQQRLVSGLGEAERRIAAVTAKLEGLGWTNPHKRGPQMQGAEWVALALRQQSLLQNICGVKDRLKRAGHRLGMTSAPHAESVAAPQLARRVPSHFNNLQLRTLLRQPAPSASGQSAHAQLDDSTPLYPLNKLLVLVIVRDLQRFMSSGAVRGIDEATIQAAKASAASSSAPAAASSAATAAVAPLDDANADDLSALSLETLMQRLVLRLCGIVVDDAQTAKLLREGLQLAILSLQLDKESRTILNEEAYLLAAGTDNLAPSAALNAAKAAFHDKQARSWFSSGVSPFAHFNFSRPPAALAEATRVPCPRCRKPASLYCPFCLLPTLPPELQIPPVQLPMQVDIIHHTGENVKKSTSIHACILAPDHARFLEHPRDLPAGGYDPTSTVLLYPTADAVFLDDPRVDILAVKRVIVIESTWNKSDVVAAHPALAGIRRVKIRERESTFWRYQELGKHFLSTLEAIYYICQEFQTRKMAAEAEAKATGNGSATVTAPLNIDDLMFFYAFQHSRITERYKTNTNVPRSWSGGATATATATVAASASAASANDV